MQHAPKCWPGGSGGETGWGVDSAGDNSDINQLSNRPLRGHHSCRKDARLEGKREHGCDRCFGEQTEPRGRGRQRGHRRLWLWSVTTAPAPRTAQKGGQRLGAERCTKTRGWKGMQGRSNIPFLSMLKQNSLLSETVWISSLESSRLPAQSLEGV